MKQVISDVKCGQPANWTVNDELSLTAEITLQQVSETINRGENLCNG